jgi:hypothetical protein
MIPLLFLASLAMFLENAMRNTWFRSASSSWIIHNLLERTTLGIFSSITSIAFFYRLGQNLVANGTVIMAA